MAYIGIQPAESFTSFATQTFSVSATTSYTLDSAVANENEIALFVNNVRQQPGSGKAYTASGTALTLSAATATTDTMYCIFLGRALQTVTPATNSITAAMVSANAVTGAKLNTDVISAQTALGAEPADTDEFLVSDAGVLKRVDYSYIKSSAGAPYFMACKTSDQDINDNTATKIQFDGQMLDSGTVYDNSSNYRFTPGVTGIYVISLTVWVYDAQTSLGDAYLYIYKNGSNITDSRIKFTSDEDKNQIGTEIIVSLDDDDYLEAYIQIDTSDSGTFRVTGSGNNTIARQQFSGFRIA
jgi:hypothetical protein